ncbi:MAG TPA: universal stress protein [Terriglobales bacterium]|jgi:nucleotide-binding universal stress UspA family protein|nr:universal stress protein [Terriglobales bacterium]
MPGFKPQHIVCLVDLSPASRLVLCWARVIAQAFASRVEILHVAEPPQYLIEGQEQAQLELTRTELHGAVGSLAQEVLGTRVLHHIVVEEGHPVQVVMGRLERHTPDLIVMGSHGHDGMARVLLGSVAENVTRVARCPTLIVKGAEPAEGSLKPILCPVNLSDSASECAQLAGILAAVLKAKLELVLAVEEASMSRGQAEEQLHAWIPGGLRRMCDISEIVLEGDAAERIVERARTGGADLVVLGAEHRRFLEFTTLGRTTERVMRYSPCSVLLVPRNGPRGEAGAAKPLS